MPCNHEDCSYHEVWSDETGDFWLEKQCDVCGLSVPLTTEELKEITG